MKGLFNSLSLIILALIIANHWLRSAALDYVALILFAIYVIYLLFNWRQSKPQLITLLLLIIVFALLIFLA